MPKTRQCESPNMIKFKTFDEYKGDFEHLFHLSRTESGVLTAQFYTGDGAAEWDYPLHRALHQLCHMVGQDAETEVLILGGSGKSFVTAGKPSVEDTPENRKWLLYEHNYYDGCNMVEGIVNDVEQPTIGIINGNAVHSEIALLCDITLMAEGAVLSDPHYFMGAYPGDGIQIALREGLGRKRANYAMLFNEPITAEEAKAAGLVNEVVPADQIYERAVELGEKIAKAHRINRRLMAQNMRYELRQQIARELRPMFASEMFVNDIVGFDHDEGFKKADF